MARKNVSISLDPDSEQRLSALIAAGVFPNASEAVRAGIALLTIASATQLAAVAPKAARRYGDAGTPIRLRARKARTYRRSS